MGQYNRDDIYETPHQVAAEHSPTLSGPFFMAPIMWVESLLIQEAPQFAGTRRVFQLA